MKKFLSTRLEKTEIFPVKIKLPQTSTENPSTRFAGN